MSIFKSTDTITYTDNSVNPPVETTSNAFVYGTNISDFGSPASGAYAKLEGSTVELGGDVKSSVDLNDGATLLTMSIDLRPYADEDSFVMINGRIVTVRAYAADGTVKIIDNEKNLTTAEAVTQIGNLYDQGMYTTNYDHTDAYGNYVLQIFQVVNGATQTYDWVTVNPNTGVYTSQVNNLTGTLTATRPVILAGERITLNNVVYLQRDAFTTVADSSTTTQSTANLFSTTDSSNNSYVLSTTGDTLDGKKSDNMGGLSGEFNISSAGLKFNDGVNAETDLTVGTSLFPIHIIEVSFTSDGTSNKLSATATFSNYGFALHAAPMVIAGNITQTVSYCDVMDHPFVTNVSGGAFTVNLNLANPANKFGAGTLKMKFLVIGN